MERKGRIEREEKVDALFAKADHWLTTAEMTMDRQKALTSCQEAVRNLLSAFLLAKGESEPEDTGLNLPHLWEKCAQLDPELLLLADCIRLCQEGEGLLSTEGGQEMLLDAANQGWDFIYGSLAK